MFAKKFLNPLKAAPLAVVLSLGTPMFAENSSRARIPEGAVLADPTSLLRMFSGRTSDWGGGSAAFWAADGTFRAVNPSEQSLGYGTWFVTSASRMCYEGTWAWRQDFGVQTRDVDVCTRFMIDAEGQVWTTTEGMGGPWFPFFDDNINTGDFVSPGFEATASMLGMMRVPADG
ncbi:DUF995 domain-containing protein [Octadecabacter ascidiaceicola]|uniref:DUF995 domain-containing protein n=1 Tax=Octadecabacter ascidiaceicola TaxID=1655543 RepID=A0A238JTG9_9RHOB|nr:DUF995 domain-containing protein [Octadecabacter ascidiaceicola]SMX33949.1 hypothetical protein OCA8868_01054 [Octadecabacter ascidiaceicola]